MSESDHPPGPARTRRAPPPFRHLKVRRVEDLSARLRRVTFTGPDLEGMTVEHPAASVRLLLPTPGDDELIIPEWQGNEFLLPDGRRPRLRTLTPLMGPPGSLEIDLDVVLHAGGGAADWARSASPGDRVALSGPGRGYAVDSTATAFVLGGDESALPAITQLLSAIPAQIPVEVHIEVGRPDGRLELPFHPAASVQWHDLEPPQAPGSALVEALTAVTVAPGARVWVAGEAASVQRIRRVLLDERGFPRAQSTIRGYWKHGRNGDPPNDPGD